MKMYGFDKSNDFAKIGSLRKNSTVGYHKDVLGGTIAVFIGTRVPIDSILQSLDVGISFDRIRNSYPFLTEDLIQDARAFTRNQVLHRRMPDA